MKRKRNLWIAVLALTFVTLFSGRLLWAVGAEQSQGDELKAKLQAEGWKPIAEGVYERQRGATKVEHLGYGREGLSWTIGELDRRLDAMVREYQKHRSEDLGQAIDDLRVTVSKARQELRNTKSLSSLGADVAGASCSICYSATADAYALGPNTQGVGAIADAGFNNGCGYSGDTYAYAYARATLNGTTTTVIQSDPHTGTSVTSHATATVNGSSDCHSESNSYAQSTALGISYSTSDSNDSCPPVAVSSPSPTITGPSFVLTGGCVTKTWSASVTGGTTPYAYQWYFNGTAVGTNSSSYSRSICSYTGDFQLQVVVTDSGARTGSDLHDVTVEEPYSCFVTQPGVPCTYQ